MSADESNPRAARHIGMRTLLAVSLALLLMPTSHADARAACIEPRCGLDHEVDIMPPPYPPPPPDGPALPRAGLPFREIAPRLRSLAGHVEECAATHLDVVPRTLSVRVTVQTDGLWGLSFGSARATGTEERVHAPLEVCVADWVSSELGPRREPLASRRPRNVVVRYRLSNSSPARTR